MNKTPDEHDPEEDIRSPLAIGISWSTTIFGLSLEAVLPCLLGLWLDQKCGTVLLFFFLGLVLGMTGVTLQLIKIARR